MVTGYTSKVVAEARARLGDLYNGIKDYNNILTASQKASDLKLDPTPYYYSARSKLIALNDDLVYMNQFVLDNKDELENIVYYTDDCKSLGDQLDAMEQALIVPSVESPVEGVAQGAGDFTGIVTQVQDADTIVLDEKKVVRFAGTDSPEGGTEAGKVATSYVTSLLLGKEVTIRVDPHTPYDLYGRHLGVPFLGDLNVCTDLISKCLAAPLTKFGKHHYVDPDENKRLHERCVMGWPRAGKCHFSTKPSKARVFLDGVDMEENTPCDLIVPVGRHQVTYVAAGCSSVREDIEVKGNYKMDIPERILPKLATNVGTVIISTEPSDQLSVVTVGGVLQGVAPIIMDLPSDVPTMVSVASSGYKVTADQAKAVLGTVARLVVQLEKV